MEEATSIDGRWRVTASARLEDEEWDAFLAGVPNVHMDQTTAWARVRSVYGHQVRRLVVREGDRVVAGAQILLRKLGRWGRAGFLPRGPVIHPDCAALESVMLREIDRLARRLRLFYLTVDFPYDAGRLAALFRSAGYLPQPARLPPTTLLTATLVLDLQRSDEDLLAGMNSSTRRNIRLSQRQGFKVEPGGREDLDTFRQLMLATVRRRRAVPGPPEPDFFHQLWDQFADRGWLRVLLVRRGAEAVSGAVMFTFGDLARVWKVGWSGAYSAAKPNELMWWEALRVARQGGSKALDFYWVDEVDAVRAAAGQLDPAGFRDGTTHFKLGFGGRLLMLPAALCRFYHPVTRLAWVCGAGRLLDSPWFYRATNRVLHRFSRHQRSGTRPAAAP